jgi:hypothetical protein
LLKKKLEDEIEKKKDDIKRKKIKKIKRKKKKEKKRKALDVFLCMHPIVLVQRRNSFNAITPFL